MSYEKLSDDFVNVKYMASDKKYKRFLKRNWKQGERAGIEEKGTGKHPRRRQDRAHFDSAGQGAFRFKFFYRAS
jgi:hypothetical protein